MCYIIYSILYINIESIYICISCIYIIEGESITINLQMIKLYNISLLLQLNHVKYLKVNVQKILLIPIYIKLLSLNCYTMRYKLHVKIKNLNCH